jgi:hypothetical protein
MNLHWPDFQELMRGDGIFADSAIAVVIFKIRLSTLVNLIQKHQILGKVSAFVWRIEYLKRGLPHAHILFSTDFDTQDMDAVDVVINARHPKNSPFIMAKEWYPIFANGSAHIRYIIIPNVADFPMVSVGSVIFKKWPDTQEYLVTTIVWPGMQMNEIS